MGGQQPKQSKEEILKKDKPLETPDDQSKSKPILIRTKASKCSKLILVTQQQELIKKNDHVNFDSNMAHSTKLESKKSDGTVSTTSEETHSINSAISEFDIGEFLTSDISDSEFWNNCTQLLTNNYIEDIDEEEEAEGHSLKNMRVSSDQHLPFSEEMLKEWIRDVNQSDFSINGSYDQL